MNAFSRSWKATKLSFRVIRKDPELLIYAIASVLLSILVFALFFIPLVLSELMVDFYTSAAAQLVNFGLYFILYILLFGISTFFSFAIVYTAAQRFAGKNARFFESLGFAFSKIHLVIVWSLVAGTVGIMLKLLERLGRKQGLGALFARLTNSIVGLAWSLATIFVMPVMVYKGVGPFKAIRDSTLILKKTWGESLIKAFGLGLAQFILMIVGFFVTGILMFGIGAVFGVLAGVLVFFLYILYIVILFTLFNLASQVYDTALYVYAETGKIPEGFDEDVLVHAFKKN